MTPVELKRLRENQLNAKLRAAKTIASGIAKAINAPTRRPYRPPSIQFQPRELSGDCCIQLPLPPSVNEWKTPIAKGRAILTKPYREWRKVAHGIFNAFGSRNGLLRGPLDVSMVFRFPDVRSDIDGRIKPLFDAANGTLWVDDSHVGRCSAEKLIAGKGEQPHVVMTVRRERIDGQPWDAELVKRLEHSKRNQP